MARAWLTKSKSGKPVVNWIDNGRRRSKTRHSMGQAREFKADIEHKLNMGMPSALCNVSFEALKKDYIDSKIADRRADGTLIEIKGMFKNFERICGKPTSVQIKQADIDKFKQIRGAECKSGNTLNKDLANLKAFVRYFSVDRAYIRPGLVIKPVRATVKPVRVLSEDQIGCLLRSLKQNNRRYYTRALLALCAGLDVGSIDAIGIRDIHFEDDTIDTFRPKKNKWHLARPIQKAVMAEISNFLAQQRDGQLRLLPDKYNRDKWIELCRQAGIATTFHNLRKTYASLLQKKGVALATAKELLDHETIATTQRWYTDMSSEHKKAADSLPVDGWIGD